MDKILSKENELPYKKRMSLFVFMKKDMKIHIDPNLCGFF